MEQSSFKPGGGEGIQNKPDSSDSAPKDEYKGAYKEREESYGEAEKFGTDQLPVTHDALPARGLRGAGG